MAAKGAKPIQWDVIRLGKQGTLLGIVYAPTEAAARKKAIAEFKVWSRQQGPLLIRKVSR